MGQTVVPNDSVLIDRWIIDWSSVERWQPCHAMPCMHIYGCSRQKNSEHIDRYKWTYTASCVQSNRTITRAFFSLNMARNWDVLYSKFAYMNQLLLLKSIGRCSWIWGGGVVRSVLQTYALFWRLLLVVVPQKYSEHLHAYNRSGGNGQSLWRIHQDQCLLCFACPVS